LFKKFRHPIRYSERYAYILDILTRFVKGRLVRVAQAVGEDYFILLELQPVEGVYIEVGERVYVGREMLRMKIEKILRTLNYSDLTLNAQAELPKIIEKIVCENESRFVDFFNKSDLITIRLHKLSLIPGVGRKYLKLLLTERKRRPFESFKDIEERTGFKNPKKAIVERILKELREDEKYYLFVVKPKTLKL